MIFYAQTVIIIMWLMFMSEHPSVARVVDMSFKECMEKIDAQVAKDPMVHGGCIQVKANPQWADRRDI